MLRTRRNVIHDLNNHLAGIKLAVDFLEGVNENNKDVLEIIHKIQRAIRESVELIDELNNVD